MRKSGGGTRDDLYHYGFGEAPIKQEGVRQSYDTEREPWATNIPQDIQDIPLHTLIELWHLRFSEAPAAHELQKEGAFYFHAARRLWVLKLLQKEERPNGTYFIVHTLEGGYLVMPQIKNYYANHR